MCTFMHTHISYVRVGGAEYFREKERHMKRLFGERENNTPRSKRSGGSGVKGLKRLKRLRPCA